MNTPPPQNRSAPRIFLGLTEVSGYYAQLRKGFVELGVECVHIPIQAHRFAYEEAPDMGWPARLTRFFVKRRVMLPEAARWRRRAWLLPVMLTRLILFVWAVRRFDVFIMGGGSSFFRFWDLPVLRWLGRRVIYVLHGTDARPAYLDGSFYQERHAATRQNDLDPPALDDEFIDGCVAATAVRYRDVRWIERYAHTVVCGPGFAQLLDKPFVNFAAVGIPFSPPDTHLPTPRPPDGRVRILHATSDMVCRGTRITRRLIEELVDKGLPIDFIVMTGQPHLGVLEALQACDFVVDGQWADTPMAGFAAESARFGKPVVMGGYYAANVRRDMPPETIPPTCFTTPDQMQATIERLVMDADHRRQVGEDMRRFMLETWTPKSVAAKYLKLLDGSAPESWWNDPHRNLYHLGGGLSGERIRAIVQAILARHGEQALLLEHNPVLRDMLMAFVREARN